METFTITYPLIWLVLWVIFALLVFLKNSFKIRDELGGFPLHELTVIVPFRNERTNLPKLLASIKKQDAQPANYIFVDDHSTDSGDVFIQEQLGKSSISFEIITLSQHLHGKKIAIMEAAQMSSTKYLQTLDADVWFESNFFNNLPEPKNYDMMILPVRMLGNNTLQKIMELEYGSFQLLQAFVPKKKPLMASGANLIVNRQIYLETNDLSKHAHRSSGDDQYALAQFIAAGKKINTYFDSDLAIFTNTPENISALLTQRARWMGNNSQGNDYRALVLSFFIFAINISLLWLLAKGFFLGFSGISSQIILAKIIADFIVYFCWFKRNNTWPLAPYLPFLSLTYPVYLILLLSKYIRHKKHFWKNRPV